MLTLQSYHSQNRRHQRRNLSRNPDAKMTGVRGRRSTQQDLKMRAKNLLMARAIRWVVTLKIIQAKVNHKNSQKLTKLVRPRAGLMTTRSLPRNRGGLLNSVLGNQGLKIGKTLTPRRTWLTLRTMISISISL